ncbi:MAG: hypothetical protein LBP36_00275 [Oscillospiraceae bacterium]|nr:hypothetical protein [Oscillospiraceae bacterium]
MNTKLFFRVFIILFFPLVFGYGIKAVSDANGSVYSDTEQNSSSFTLNGATQKKVPYNKDKKLENNKVKQYNSKGEDTNPEDLHPNSTHRDEKVLYFNDKNPVVNSKVVFSIGGNDEPEKTEPDLDPTPEPETKPEAEAEAEAEPEPNPDYENGNPPTGRSAVILSFILSFIFIIVLAVCNFMYYYFKNKSSKK